MKRNQAEQWADLERRGGGRGRFQGQPLSKMPQSTCARPRKLRSTWSPPILKVWDSGEAPGDKRRSPSECGLSCGVSWF